MASPVGAYKSRQRDEGRPPFLPLSYTPKPFQLPERAAPCRSPPGGDNREDGGVIMKLAGKVAIISGAGSGVGRATMVLFAREGAKVVGCGRTAASGEETMRLVREAGGDGCFIPTDVRISSDVERLISETVKSYGRLDILVNNASVGYSYPGSMDAVADTPEADWDDVISINLKSVYLMSRFSIPEMRKAGGGSIVNVASIGGVRGMPDAHAYSAAKGGVVNLTRSMAITYGPEKIRVNCMAPGGIDTEMIASRMADINTLLADPATATMISPMCRVGQPEEMAKAILYLASDDASYTNGALLVVDGGSIAGW
jgi:NAD(P)-dependent dehydrogenase (short-subunit alcohol dehydrogenase family)